MLPGSRCPLIGGGPGLAAGSFSSAGEACLLTRQNALGMLEKVLGVVAARAPRNARVPAAVVAISPAVVVIVAATPTATVVIVIAIVVSVAPAVIVPAPAPTAPAALEDAVIVTQALEGLRACNVRAGAELGGEGGSGPKNERRKGAGE